MVPILSQIQVAVPFIDLMERYFDLVLKNRVQPEIGLSADALDRYSFKEFQTVAARLASEGLSTTLHAPFMDLCPASRDPLIRRASRDRLRRAFDLIVEFHPRSVVCHLGFEPRMHLESLDLWVDGWLNFWEECGPLFREQGIRMNIENVFEWDSQVFEAVFDRIPPEDMGFCFDTGHCVAFSRITWQEWMEKLGDRLGQIHVHDNLGDFDEHRAVGEGTFPFEPFFRDLAAEGRRPIVTLEAHREDWVWTSLRTLTDLWPWEWNGETADSDRD